MHIFNKYFFLFIARPLIRVYQMILSPVLVYFGSRCRFEPSCSNYALEAFEKHGIFRGFWLSSIRLAKCNPLHPGGEDPVP